MSTGAHSTVPTLVALLICDQVIDDKLTNKKSAIGLFNTVIVPSVPGTIHHLCVLATVTEISNRTQLALRFVRDADDSVLFQTEGPVEAPNPLATVDVLFGLQGLRIPAVGQYAFELWGSGELLGRRRFQVLQMTPPPRG